MLVVLVGLVALICPINWLRIGLVPPVDREEEVEVRVVGLVETLGNEYRGCIRDRTG